MRGNEILARCLLRHGIEDIFYLMGGPMLECEAECERLGIRMIDVRHEQAASMMCNAYSRIKRAPSVCMAASGPGTMNLVTGVATAFADSAPVIALGGASPIRGAGMGAFQETDQVALFRPITRWAERCVETHLLPEYVDMAFALAFGSRPGPVYLDLPADVLYRDVPEEWIRWRDEPVVRARAGGSDDDIERAVNLLTQAERPVLVSGSGILWSGAERELQRLVEALRIPFYTTPHGRGVIAEDHELCFLGARSEAFREADVILTVGTRHNYVVSFMRAPRWNAVADLIQIDIDPAEIGRSRQPAVGIVGDAKTVLTQLLTAREGCTETASSQAWCTHLRGINERKLRQQEERMAVDSEPIHPLRLCKEVRDILPRDAILSVDGQEILTYARQSIPFYEPHSLNSGPYGCMGVGLPFGLGAKLAAPDKTVVVLHGDGSFGINAMEMDTAVRHGIPVVCVISNNGGWAASKADRPIIGRELGYTRYDTMFETIGCHGEFVERPSDIRPALERALASGKPAVVNVITDSAARAQGVSFAMYDAI
jgi:thiamine pyrophosphate-dependent acetolactate synthase large subunit-like protein